MVEVGKTVKTKYGEVLEVLEVKTLPAKEKKGVVVQAEQHMFLAQSGDHKVWFPVSHVIEGEEA